MAILLAGCSLLLSGSLIPAAENQSAVDQPKVPWPGATALVIGRDDQGHPVTAWMDHDALNCMATGPLVAVIVGSTAANDSERQSLSVLRDQFHRQIDPDTRCVVIPGGAGLVYPPQGSAYNTDGQRTAAAIWRSLGWLGPDFVVELTTAGNSGRTKEKPLWQAVSTEPVARIGTVPSLSLTVASLQQPDAAVRRIQTAFRWQTVVGEAPPFSPLRAELRRRHERTAGQCADQLAKVYGHELKTVMYQPALAIMARLERASRTGDASVEPDVRKILEPWLAKADAGSTIDKKSVNGSVNAGHLIFAAWADRTGDPRAVKLVQQVADLAFTADGQPLAAMPAHQEMSDAVFMACPILTAAGRLTGDGKYLDMARRQLQFMHKLCLRQDGLYRHSPLCEAAWGRGNGFPMLGLALSLTDLDLIARDSASSAALKTQAAELQREFRDHLQRHAAALLKHQDATGMWRQVIDEPGAYREMTATCMIGFALQRGVQRGWLDRTTFQSAADRAWTAVSQRISADGVLFDVCTGTGKQKTLEDYFNRTAILDRDERGGAMALLFAVERAGH